MRTRITIVTMALALALASGPAAAQEQYPNRTVRIVVPTSPGAVTDVLARAIGQSLSQAWGQPVIVDDRPGADEMIGDEIIAKAPPDGYTIASLTTPELPRPRICTTRFVTIRKRTSPPSSCSVG